MPPFPAPQQSLKHSALRKSHARHYSPAGKSGAKNIGNTRFSRPLAYRRHTFLDDTQGGGELLSKEQDDDSWQMFTTGNEGENEEDLPYTVVDTPPDSGELARIDWDESMHPHEYFLMERLRGHDRLKYRASPTVDEWGLTIDDKNNAVRARRKPTADHLWSALAENPEYDWVIYTDADPKKMGYSTVLSTNNGGFSTIFHVTLSKDRTIYSDGHQTVLPAGTQIIVKAQSLIQDATYRDIEAAVRLSWLTREHLTDLFVNPIGIYFSSRSNILEVHPFLKTEMLSDPCVYMEMEKAGTTFSLMRYNRVKRVSEKDYMDNFDVQQVPDHLVFEIIWGTVMADRYAGVALDDGHPGNYAVTRVPYYRVYRYYEIDPVTNNPILVSMYVFSPNFLMAKRFDYTFWHPCKHPEDCTMRGRLDAVTLFKKDFLFMYELSEKAREGIDLLQPKAKNFREVLDSTFSEYAVDPSTWQPEPGVPVRFYSNILNAE